MPLNIPALARRGAALARSSALTALTTVTVKTGPTDVYNATTDVTTTTWTQSQDVPGLLYEVTLQEVDGMNQDEVNAVVTGRAKKLLLWDSDLAIPPTEQSVVVIAGATWQVKAIAPDPTEAIYILQIRR